MSACIVGSAGRVDVGDEVIKDVEASDVDIRAMAREMAGAILEAPAVMNRPGAVVIAFLNIENRTLTTDFNSDNLLSKIRQDLIQYSGGKLTFLDQNHVNAVLAERDRKRSGAVTSSERLDLPGTDFFLTGQAYSQRKSAGAAMQAYHRYSFRLTNAETGVIVWEKDYEFKKAGARGSAYQ